MNTITHFEGHVPITNKALYKIKSKVLMAIKHGNVVAKLANGLVSNFSSKFLLVIVFLRVTRIIKFQSSSLRSLLVKDKSHALVPRTKATSFKSTYLLVLLNPELELEIK